ncbi:unnamed protein product, partial [marine sediment metagenome]
MRFNRENKGVKGNYNIKGLMKYQDFFVPAAVKELKSMSNVLIVSYESLATRPVVVLRKIFEFCGLNWSSKVKWDMVNSSRAFAYRWQGYKVDHKI